MSTDKVGHFPSRRAGTGRRAPTPAQRATVARMLCQGYTPAECAAAASLQGSEMPQEVVADMLRDPALLADMQAAAFDAIRAALPQAVAVVRGQMSADNDWIAQNAARVVFDLAQRVTATADSAPVVTFGGMPAPGLPSTTADE